MKQTWKKVLLVLGAILLVILMFAPPVHRAGKASKMAMCRVELAAFNSALTQFKAVYTNLPAGSTADVIKYLRGDNARKIAFVNLRPDRLLQDGDYLDPWGTPYEIRIDASINFVVRSAGPNKMSGDADDFVFDSATVDSIKP